MTQLVELQRMIPVLDEQHVAAYSVSYDGTSVLAAFGEREGITFPMLSDIGSVVITRLGLKNDRVYEQHFRLRVQAPTPSTKASRTRGSSLSTGRAPSRPGASSISTGSGKQVPG